MASSMTRPGLSGLVAVAILLASGCVRQAQPRRPDDPSRKLTGTSYFESGRDLFIGVDVRAARVGGPENLLPLLVTVVKQSGEPARMDVGRESFVLQLPDNRRRPLATYGEYENDYRRGRVDQRLSDVYLTSLTTRFPDPPFSWLPLDFFPLRASGTFPRESVDLRVNQLTHGYLYFAMPGDAPDEGRYNLLFTPLGSETTYVVNFSPYHKERAR